MCATEKHRERRDRGPDNQGRLQLLVLVVMAALSVSCVPADQCAERGTSWCAGNTPKYCEQSCSDWGCHLVLRTGDCTTRTCIDDPAVGAQCAESADKDPRCGDAASARYCSGNDIATCVDGYRIVTEPCPDSGLVSATECIEPEPGAAVCIPPGAQIAAICQGGGGPKCDGTTLVWCIRGYAATSTPCHTCVVPACTDCTSAYTCSGQVGEWCQTDADCAAGLICTTQPSSSPQEPPLTACAEP